MPMNKIRATSRGKAAIVAVLLAFAGGSYGLYNPKTETVIVDGQVVPPAVMLSIETLIKPWEGVELRAYLDAIGVPTICWGETKGVKLGMRKTRDECDRMLIATVMRDYYGPISKHPNFTVAPDSVQASMISGAYNFGVARWLSSTAAKRIAARDWRGACEAMTAFNRAGGKIMRGLVNRREMGDAQRLGEAELCVSGL